MEKIVDYNKLHAFKISQLRDSYGNVTYPEKRAVVVGGTSGIGRGIAVRLAEADISTTIVGRNEENGKEVLEEMRSAQPKNAKGVHNFIKCDAQLLGNVREFCKSYSAEHPQLDLLVLTCGIATTQGFTATSEGLDQKLSLHFYARMAFVHHLLPILKKAPSPRILTVLSGGVHAPYHHMKSDPELKENYSLKHAADAAGFYNDLMMDAFARENPECVFLHSAPGFVNTNWGTEMPLLIKGFVRMLQPLGKSASDCAEFMCEGLLNPNYPPGFYVRGENGQSASKTSQHTDENVQFIRDHLLEVINRS